MPDLIRTVPANVQIQFELEQAAERQRGLCHQTRETAGHSNHDYLARQDR